MFKTRAILLPIAIVLFAACQSDKSDNDNKDKEGKVKKYTRFSGKYNTVFNDLQDVHFEAASQNGVGPFETRNDTLKYKNELTRIPAELDIYKVDELKHSMPFLVPAASTLLSDICINFRDSLKNKKMSMYKPIVTSVLRTDDDVKNLSKRNRNASENSVHRYGTTFDISWRRFQKIDESDKRTLNDGQLKAILGQVLHDLRERDRCYIKHERKQACFHITVR